ncbi:MAG: hypothetical protein EOO41_01330 [Methanobacteriota archaeon]|nr:MAG: hypothetical protein EOO41_01330 [Euryarchaeota archaeon]
MLRVASAHAHYILPHANATRSMSTPTTPQAVRYTSYAAAPEPGSAASAALGRHRFATGDRVYFHKTLHPESRDSSGHAVATHADSQSVTQYAHVVRVIERASDSTLYLVREEDGGVEVICSSAALHRARS